MSAEALRQRRAVVATGTEVSTVSETMPALRDGWVRIEIHYAGICHSDIAAIAGGTFAEPTHVGHEAAGIVIESNEASVAIGTRVVAYVADGYADTVDAPVNRIAAIDDECSMLDAALAEPVACVIGAIEMLRLTDCTEVVVVGAGFMGLLAVRYLALLGHSVTVFEPVEQRRAIALALGAARALAPDDALHLYPKGNELVIEATGSAPGLTLASDLVAIAGTLGILGYHQSGEGMRTVPMERWNFKAISVLSLHHRDPERVMQWIARAQRSAARGGIVPSEVVDARFSLDEAAEGLRGVPAAQAPIKAVFAMR